jgi:AbrB family looped-hinge helix DNA binding protein
MMKARLTIDRAGRVLIPKEVRDELNIKAGDALELEFDGEGITLRLARRNGTLVREAGVWVFRTNKPLASKVSEKVLARIRADRDRRNLGIKG